MFRHRLSWQLTTAITHHTSALSPAALKALTVTAYTCLHALLSRQDGRDLRKAARLREVSMRGLAKYFACRKHAAHTSFSRGVFLVRQSERPPGALMSV